jgi:hypothetical protein
MPIKYFDSIFKAVEKAKTKKEKIEILKQNSSPTLKAILGHTYDPNVKWLLPEGTPPHKSLSENSDAEITMGYAQKQFYLFVEGPTDTQKNLKQMRREQLFIQLLESVHPCEVKVLIGMKDRKLPYKGVTRKLVAEAFPNLARNWFS